MSKFCRIFENEKGQQLLIMLVSDEDNADLAGVKHVFEMHDEGAFVQVTIGGVKWSKADEYLENYKQEDAELILADPYTFLTTLNNR